MCKRFIRLDCVFSRFVGWWGPQKAKNPFSFSLPSRPRRFDLRIPFHPSIKVAGVNSLRVHHSIIFAYLLFITFKYVLHQMKTSQRVYMLQLEYCVKACRYCGEPHSTESRMFFECPKDGRWRNISDWCDKENKTIS